MKQNTDHEELLANYLLGQLPEAEQLRLEERFFTDNEYYEQLLALEDELRYDYAAGGLSPAQRASFERRFLTSPQARAQAELARAVLDKVAEPVRSLTAPAEKKSRWQALRAFFSLQHPALQFSLAAAASLSLVGASWLFYQTTRLRAQVERLETARAGQEQQTAAERARQQQLAGELARERSQRAQLEQELASQQAAGERQPASAASFLSFVLAPGLVRDVASLKRLAIPPGSQRVRLRLTLKRAADYQSYRAVLQTLDGAARWQQNLPRPKSSAAGQAIVVNLPARLLPPGDYVLALQGQTPGGVLEEIDEYYFNVVRP